MVECCQICGHAPLENVLSLGCMPPPNRLTPIGQPPKQQSWYPTNFLYCGNCGLAQLGIVVDPAIVFPPEFPYTTGNTKALRDNFAELYRECSAILDLKKSDLIVDVGSNDGTLLANFKTHNRRVLGIEPTDVGDIAKQARDFDSQALFQSRGRARGQARARTSKCNHRHELLCPHRRCARDNESHRGIVKAGRRLHL